jgi:(S)-mandelate dehydrogenase
VVKKPNSLDRQSEDAVASANHALLQRFPLFADLMARAEKRIPKRIAGYLLGGADSERGLAENVAAFQRIRLMPRYGVDIANLSTRIDLFGRTYAAPIGVAPVGYTSAIWPGAERALASAAQAANLPFITSTYAIEPLEAIARYAPDVAWFQLYYIQTMETTLDLVRRADRAGIKVLVVTIDIPTYSKRSRDHRNGLEFPPAVTPSLLWEVAQRPAWSVEFLKHPYPLAGNLMPYAKNPNGGTAAMRELFAATGVYGMSWDEIATVRKAWPGKLVIKGVQHPDDAEAALKIGADGLIVSNHGGRQLDAAPASIDALPAIVERVGARTTVMLDSGVRSGLDVVKAMVRGAHCCFAGRPFVAACAAAGNEGAPFAMQLFKDEIDTAFGQLGICGVHEATGDRAREFH